MWSAFWRRGLRGRCHNHRDLKKCLTTCVHFCLNHFFFYSTMINDGSEALNSFSSPLFTGSFQATDSLLCCLSSLLCCLIYPWNILCSHTTSKDHFEVLLFVSFFSRLQFLDSILLWYVFMQKKLTAVCQETQRLGQFDYIPSFPVTAPWGSDRIKPEELLLCKKKASLNRIL